jgi:hypothetical protein
MHCYNICLCGQFWGHFVCVASFGDTFNAKRILDDFVYCSATNVETEIFFLSHLDSYDITS